MKLNLVHPGMVLSVLVKNGNCYTNDGSSNYQTFLGTISQKNFSWVGNIEVVDGVMDLVVLEAEEGKPIVFGKKHLTSIEDLSLSVEDIQFLFEKIEDLEKTVECLEYLKG